MLCRQEHLTGRDCEPVITNSWGIMMKISLYTVTYAGIWYNGPALGFEDIVHRAKDYGYDGVELDGKRPHGNPMDLDGRTRERIVPSSAGGSGNPVRRGEQRLLQPDPGDPGVPAPDGARARGWPRTWAPRWSGSSPRGRGW